LKKKKKLFDKKEHRLKKEISHHEAEKESEEKKLKASRNWANLVDAVIQKEVKNRKMNPPNPAPDISTTTTSSLEDPATMKQSMGMSFIFEDPISMEIMQEADMVPCGHSFSKKNFG